MPIKIVKKPPQKTPDPIVENDPGPKDVLRKMLIELARQDAWNDHVASLKEREKVA